MTSEIAAIGDSIAAVTGGTVVTPDGLRRADVLISGGQIAAIGDAGPVPGPALDATGCWVLPGGVDPHCHAMADIRAATAAAARGGTTTVLSFTNPEPGESDLDCLIRRREQARGGAIDVGLHATIYDPEHVTDADLAAFREAGAAGVKVFLAYPEWGIMCSPGALYRVMAGAARLGLVVQVHCESGPLIEELIAVALRDGATGPGVFASTRPPEVEEEAVATALATAALTGATCYLVHLSTEGAVDQVRLARRRGRPRVVAEVCLHHLLLDDACYAGPDAERYLVCPPLRPRRHVDALWAGIADGTIDAVGSDHCQDRSPTLGAIAEAGQSYEFGLAGIGARLPLLLSEGLARGLPPTRLAQLAAEGPARALGFYPAKGALVAGADADLVVFDPDGQSELTGPLLDDGTGPSIYAGRALRGRIRAVLSRGRPAIGPVADGPAPGGGYFVRPR